MQYDDYIGKSETRTDEISPRLIQGMAATLGVPEPAELPPLWHWMLFQVWVQPGELGPDGHPRRGGFLPPVHDLPRRMWAGGRLWIKGPLRAGDEVTRTSTILSVKEKQGGSGKLVFVTVRHEIAGPNGPALEEEHDIVYRGTEGAATRPAEPVTDRLRPGEGVAGEVVPDPVLLFRYSALTGNGHRIHYDLEYVRNVEGYPGLVVHGPLQATWLAGLLAGKKLDRFTFRGLRPAFHGNKLFLEAREGGPGYLLRTLDESGALCMQAEAQCTS